MDSETDQRLENVIRQVIDLARAGAPLGQEELAALFRSANEGQRDTAKHISKKQVVSLYNKVRATDPERFASWGMASQVEARVSAALRMKPGRTASGVATITVLTKPWPCSGNCRYCPNDVRMPKSYLTDEPACQRAERNFFDPYLQVVSRVRALAAMGHITDKVEMIVLGGTFCDYPQDYQRWFASELFRALNDLGDWARAEANAAQRVAAYEALGLTSDKDELGRRTADIQARVTAGDLTYNQAFALLYGEGPWAAAAAWQTTTADEVERQQRINESASKRIVGLVIETQPHTLTPASLTLLRRLGCTKIQMGVQTLDEGILAACNRPTTDADIARAFQLLRLFGFKIHAHFMANLPGATPDSDKADYLRFATGTPFQPDEVKLYPCVLIQSAALCNDYAAGTWTPYDEEQLVDVLAEDTLASQSFTRISRMIRDFSAGDIAAGCRKTNLRQMVEARVAADPRPVREIRMREISTDDVDVSDLRLDEVVYQTGATTEHFLQWVTPENRLAGILRLSLPHPDALAALGDEAPAGPGEAMIREVHVYGRVAGLGSTNRGNQHLGLGRKLIARARQIAAEAGYDRLNVISSIGTREYYRSQGFDRFSPNGLYQQTLL